MTELNPNHPVTIEIRDQWHKLCAIALHKLGKPALEITVADIQSFNDSGWAITVRPVGDVITLMLVTETEATYLARKEGGLPA